jgi:type VI secretion system protein
MNRPAQLSVIASLALLQLGGAACVRKVHCFVAINVSGEVNAKSPIAFDLVAANDKDLVKELSKMTAADWFQKRDQINRDFPSRHALLVKEWEWVPGQVVPDIKFSVNPAPRLLIAFANYNTPGPHRAKLDPKSAVLIQLNREDFQLSPLKGEKK